VAAGQAVDAGQVIGLSGNSGRSSAPHLHFEIRHDGQPIDPRTLVKEQS
jgi:murein DD-endopeptidase MepM/ murein hydrolase activator NlpD